jgi:hypothetical protein
MTIAGALAVAAIDVAAAYPFQSGFGSVLSALGLIRPRNIGPFVCDITISERHRDEMMITQHPIEIGSVIADHAFKKPIKAVLTVGFSNSSLKALGDVNYVQTIYQNFLTLQQNAIPFSVTTGKRTLSNMLIEYINELTTEQTENALILEIACQEVILVSTSTASTQPTGTGSPGNQSTPSVNAPAAQQGTQQVSSANNVNNPALYRAAGIPQNVSF